MFFWNISDVFGVVILVLALVAGSWIVASRLLKQRFCKHADYHEDRSCNAICRDCGKNLGFIGDVRAAKD